MFLLKSTIISSAFLLFSTSPFVQTESSFGQDGMAEYCYEISLNVNFSTPTGIINATTVARGCGDSPQEGLDALGEAVRALLPEA